MNGLLCFVPDAAIAASLQKDEPRTSLSPLKLSPSKTNRSSSTTRKSIYSSFDGGDPTTGTEGWGYSLCRIVKQVDASSTVHVLPCSSTHARNYEYADQEITVSTDIILPANELLKSEGVSDDDVGVGGAVADLITLTHLNEPAVVQGLWTRYEDDKIYTAVGPILIAVNPFKKTNLYSESIMDNYASTTATPQQQQPSKRGLRLHP